MGKSKKGKFYKSSIPKWLNDNDILMQLIHNEGNEANDSKSHLSYLNKLVEEHNNTYHRSID